ncbi:MAG: Cof-type HAD-IIB family hydrolase [Candidatus Limiplasma sp.]|nr:Cof-type HAD-IIB family hydrolase [Candidatus Limiplasma sp.]
MNTKEIKLIAMDMDGTLLNEDKEISGESRAALHEAVDKGISIAICSGRSSGDNSIFASQAGLDKCYILAYNGAYCLESPHGKPYARHIMPKQAALAALAVLKEYDVSYACFLADRIVAVENGLWPKDKGWVAHAGKPGAPRIQQGLPEVERLQGEGIHKIVYIERHEERRIEEIRQRLLPIQGMDVTSSWANNLELIPSGVNKGTAVRELAQRLGLSPENVMAIGDYDNDIPMLRYAGWGIAMGNASEAVKKAAPYATAANAQEGVAQAIRQYAL